MSRGVPEQSSTHSLTQVFMVCPPDIRRRLESLSPAETEGLEEIRLRLGQPVQLLTTGCDRFLHQTNGVTDRAADGLTVTSEHILRVIQAVTQSSMYAVEEDVRRGFVTMPGGHRVGVAGRVILGDNGLVRSVRSVYSLNIRVARERKNCAGLISSYAYDRSTGRAYSVLLVSPPQCGKTTILRDLARMWSCGTVSPRVLPAKVTVIDERSEIAGYVDGLAQFDVGPRTDVLDGCPKAEGVFMAIRSLSPTIVVTDEIGRDSDTDAILEATHSGVAVFASVHASSVQEFAKRPSMRALFEAKAFDRYVVLSRTAGPGTVERIEDADLRRLYTRTASEGTRVNLK